MTWVTPQMSLYIFTSHEDKCELIDALGLEPEEAWSVDEYSRRGNIAGGGTLWIVEGPHATGVRYDSPLQSTLVDDNDAVLHQLLDRLEPIVRPLQRLKLELASSGGRIEIALRLTTTVHPGFRTGLSLGPDDVRRISRLGADLLADFAFSPFDITGGNRYRPVTPKSPS